MNAKGHSIARGYLRHRKLNAIPAIDYPTVKRVMDSGKKLVMPGEEGECEFRLIRRELDHVMLSEAVSFMMEGGIYPYSVHLPAFQLGDGEHASDLMKAIDTIIECVDPALFVLHVSKPSLKTWGSELRAALRDLPPDRILALENVGVDGDKMRFPDRVPLVLEAIGDPLPSNLGFCLDVTHVIPRDKTKGSPKQKEEEIISTVFDFINAMGARLRHIHLSNTRYDGDNRLQHQPLEDGFLDMGRIKTALVGSGFSGKCVLEFKRYRIADAIDVWNSF